MRESERLALACAAHALPQVTIQHVSRDVMSLISAADVVVANGGYQQTCELLTLRRRAVVVPATGDAAEQNLRAERLAEIGLLRLIRPNRFDAQKLLAAVLGELLEGDSQVDSAGPCSVSGMEFVTSTILGLMDLEPESGSGSLAPNPGDDSTSTRGDIFDLNLVVPRETGTFAAIRAQALH
jgi:predicted glycosyltransferase